MEKPDFEHDLHDSIEFWNNEGRKSIRIRKRLIYMGILFFILFSTLDFSVNAKSINANDDLNQASSLISDISDHWAEKEIQEWTAQGLINGYEDHRFKPDQTITRAEFISIIDRVLALKTEADTGFTDIKNTDWYSASIKRAKYIGYITGYHDGTIHPEKNISRQEAAAIIARLLRLSETENNRALNEFTDSDAIPDWSLTSLNEVVKRGYLRGYPDKTTRPEAPITRAETVTMLANVFGTIVREGTFGPDLGTQKIEGNLTINNTGVKLQNLLIEGDLYCTAGIGDGTTYIENCKIQGRTIISGGGEHSVIFTNTASSELILYKTDGKVRIVARNNTSLPEVRMETPAVLEEQNIAAGGFESIEIITVNPGESIALDGNYESIFVKSHINISINGTTTINNMYLAEEAAGTVITLGKQAVIKNITIDAATKVIGGGSLISASINANWVSIEQQVQNLSIADNVQFVIIDGKTVTPAVHESGGGLHNDSNNSGGPVNRPPTALNDSTITTKNNSVLIDVLANDSDPDGNPLLITGYTQSGHGSVVQEDHGNRLNYTPEADFIGSDSFTYTISDGDGGTAAASVNITVNEPLPLAPAASFASNPASGDAPLTVTFTNTSTGTVDSLAWDFNGDGTPDNTTDNTVNFTYITPGTYNATLTVSNAGGSDSIGQTITVNEPLPLAPSAGFTSNPTSGDAPLTVTFTNTSTGTVDSLAWDFNGDGTPDNTTDNTVNFTYDTPGTYNATLTVTNAGGSDITSQMITVNEPLPLAPVASFASNTASGDAPLAVTFTNTSAGTVDSMAWDFNGDGAPDNTTDNTVNFTYDTPGTYNATLTVTNAGGSDTTSQTITVNEPLPLAPAASFASNPASGDAPLIVTFTNTSTGTVDSMAWDFNGDGIPDNTTDNTVNFTYDTPGIYNATLTVTNAGGSDTTSQTITVN